LPVQEILAVGADKTEARAATQVEEAGGIANRGVLGQSVAVVVHRFGAVDLREARAQSVMEFVQSQVRHADNVAFRRSDRILK
jgi:hypothetical protein